MILRRWPAVCRAVKRFPLSLRRKKRAKRSRLLAQRERPAEAQAGHAARGGRAARAGALAARAVVKRAARETPVPPALRPLQLPGPNAAVRAKDVLAAASDGARPPIPNSRSSDGAHRIARCEQNL